MKNEEQRTKKEERRKKKEETQKEEWIRFHSLLSFPHPIFLPPFFLLFPPLSSPTNE
jgi:hypothetical protein